MNCRHLIMVVTGCLLTLEYQSSTINPPIFSPSMQNNQPASFSSWFTKPTNGTTTHHGIILHPHFLHTVSCIGPCFIQVNNRSPFPSVSSHSSKILMPLHNYTGLLIHIPLVINLLIPETKLTEQLPESNSLTIKQTFLFNHRIPT